MNRKADEPITPDRASRPSVRLSPSAATTGRTGVIDDPGKWVQAADGIRSRIDADKLKLNDQMLIVDEAGS
jgi:hypothetical protein